METVRDATTVLMAVWVLLPAVVFVATYGTLVRISTWAGWNALLLTGVIAAFVGETLFIRLWGMWVGHDIFQLALVLLAGAAIWQRLWHLFSSTLMVQPRADAEVDAAAQ